MSQSCHVEKRGVKTEKAALKQRGWMMVLAASQLPRYLRTAWSYSFQEFIFLRETSDPACIYSRMDWMIRSGMSITERGETLLLLRTAFLIGLSGRDRNDRTPKVWLANTVEKQQIKRSRDEASRLHKSSLEHSVSNTTKKVNSIYRKILHLLLSIDIRAFGLPNLLFMAIHIISQLYWIVQIVYYPYQ